MNELTVADLQAQIIRLPARPPCMLGQTLGRLYEVDTRHINQVVKRNPERFPNDFCFRLTQEELELLRSQNVISLNINYLPLGFTREGANQLSSVLKSPVAAARSVQIMRAFSIMEEQAQLSYASRQTGGYNAQPASLIDVMRLAIDKLEEHDSAIRRHDVEIAQLRARAQPRARLMLVKNRDQIGLDLAPPPAKPKAAPQGGTHASPREHERRGHWRALSDGRRVWIRPALVGARTESQQRRTAS